MLGLKTLALVALSSTIISVQGQACPEIPDTGIDFGAAVGPFPEDVPSGCSAFEILVARGTSEPNFEPDGKFGVVVGDPVVSNVSRIISGARGYPVQYPASSSVITSGLAGRRDVVNRLTRQSSLCPNQRFALVGYSQGADVMHRAADEIPTSLYPKILALAMFGDPNIRTTLGDRFPAALEAKLLQSCATRDPTCSRNGDCTFFHLTYIRPEWINRATNFIVNAFRGTPLPPSQTIGPW